jgi:hypothetical protein
MRIGSIVSVVLLALAFPATARAQGGTASVTVVHGLPQFTADIYVNGKLLLDGFEPKTATQPLERAPGNYNIQIRETGSAADSTPALEGNVTVPSKANLSIIAYLSSDGQSALKVYRNDLSPIPAGDVRLVVRHAASAGPLDVQVDSTTLSTDLTNGTQSKELVSAGTHRLLIASPDGGKLLLDPKALHLKEGTSYIVYVIGSQANATLDLMAQTLSLPSPPTGVPTGDGGRAGEPTRPPWVLPLMGVGIAGVLASSVVLSSRRRLRKA